MKTGQVAGRGVAVAQSLSPAAALIRPAILQRVLSSSQAALIDPRSPDTSRVDIERTRLSSRGAPPPSMVDFR